MSGVLGGAARPTWGVLTTHTSSRAGFVTECMLAQQNTPSRLFTVPTTGWTAASVPGTYWRVSLVPGWMPLQLAIQSTIVGGHSLLLLLLLSKLGVPTSWDKNLGNSRGALSRCLSPPYPVGGPCFNKWYLLALLVLMSCRGCTCCLKNHALLFGFSTLG